MPEASVGRRDSAVRIRTSGKSDVGRRRQRNEDRFLIADLAKGVAPRDPALLRHDVGARGALWLVADGMGGAAGGELASAMAAERIYRHLVRSWTDEEGTDPERFADQLREAVEVANEEIHAYARAHPELRGMGTTATVAGLLGTCVYLAQVGDSRAYLVRDRQARQLTKDQSLVQQQVDSGLLTAEEAGRSQQRNILLQAVGSDARVEVALTREPVRAGDIVVLCSDGLSMAVSADEIAEIVSAEPDVAAACDRLIVLANERGGADNITVIVARFGDGRCPREAHDGADPPPGCVAALADGSAAPGSDEDEPRDSKRDLPWRVLLATLLAAAMAAAAAYIGAQHG